MQYDVYKYKVKYRENGYLENDYHIDKIFDIEKKIKFFKSDNEYIRYVIENMKDTVMRRYSELPKLKIKLAVFDKNNIVHRFIVNCIMKLTDILKIVRKPKLYKTIFLFVFYEGNIVYSHSAEFL